MARAGGQALSLLADRYAAAGQVDAALSTARRVLEIEPWREGAHRSVMRLLALDGRRAAALAQYEICRQALADAFGAAPSTATEDLRQAIDEGRLGPAVAASKPPNNLPAPQTSFIGRGPERALLLERLTQPDGRLVTLTGPGGVGKTRLALRAAHDLLPHFPHGVFLVHLAGVTEPELVPEEIAGVLGLAPSGRTPALTQVIRQVRDRRLLLVMDNVEHLPGAVEVILALLAAAPGVAVLVTSRARLNVVAEWVIPVAGLAVPPAGVTADIEGYAAVQLFVDRATRAQPGFRLEATTADAVARLCRSVGGLPLAIEMAAAQVANRTCQAIAAAVAVDPGTLDTSLRDIPPRQRSLAVVFRDSWTTLSDAQREAFCALCVFRGGFEPQAAVVVASADAGMLASLADRSFLRAMDGARLDIHPVLRTLGAETRRSDPEAELAVHLRHADWLLALFSAEEETLAGPRPGPALERLALEHDNLRAALAWCAGDEGDVALGLRLAAASFRFWQLRGHLAEGRVWLSRLLARSGSDAPLEAGAKARSAAGVLAYLQGDLEQAQALQEASLDAWRLAEDDLGVARALNNLGLVALTHDDYDAAESAFRESLAVMTEIHDRQGMANARLNLGYVAFYHEDYAAAQGHFQAALDHWRAIGNIAGTARVLGALGDVARATGDTATARRLFEDSVEAWRQTEDRQGTARGLNDLGRAAFDAGDLPAARAWFEQSLAVRTELGLRGDMAGSYSNLGVVAEHLGDTATAERHFRAALAIWRELGDRNGTAHSLLHLGHAALVGGDTTTAARHYRESLALWHDLDQHRAGLAALDGLAAALATLGDGDIAARLTAAATEIAADVGPTAGDAAAERRARQAAELEQALGPAAFAAAWSAGSALGWEGAVALALGDGGRGGT